MRIRTITMDSKHLQGVRGFTLIEFVIVIILMGIIGGAVTLIWPKSNINLGAQARQLASDLRYAQALSMSKDQRYRVVKLSSTTYQIQDSTGTAITLPVGGTTVTLNSDITFGTLTNLPNSLVVFGGSGIPYSDTAIPGTALASTATIPLTNGTFTQTISISPQTGRIIVQ